MEGRHGGVAHEPDQGREEGQDEGSYVSRGAAAPARDTGVLATGGRASGSTQTPGAVLAGCLDDKISGIA